MAERLFPLTFKAGIKRDGTPFQPEYCINGNWVRFQRGKVKKIGGMKGIATYDSFYTSYPATVTEVAIIDSVNKCFVCATDGIYSYEYTPDWLKVNNVKSYNFNNPNIMWSSLNFYYKSEQRNLLLFMGTNTLEDINNNSYPLFTSYNIIDDNPIEDINNQLLFDNPNIINSLNGGMCASDQYLFLYGSNGLVSYSSQSSPFEFREKDDDNAVTGAGSFTISSDKVIHGVPIRGGSNSPALLFWTLSSVVRVTNSAAAGEEEVSFKIDIISNSSSILSSKCVVEYDGLFFWPGTDRFFVYNGIVQEMVNNINLNYFFDNLNMEARQKVFGVKNTRYGEIWWFYPSGNSTTNDRAIIYNKRENAWYDTAIERDAGVFAGNSGYMVTYGKPIVDSDEFSYIWRHETGVDEEWIPDANKDTDNAYVCNPIPSFFTTPYFSWAAFPPLEEQKKGGGIDNQMILSRIEPDFVTNADNAEINIIVNTKEYANSATTSIEAGIFNFNTDTKLDTQIQGRHISIMFTSEYDFEMGNIMLLLDIGDGN